MKRPFRIIFDNILGAEREPGRNETCRGDHCGNVHLKLHQNEEERDDDGSPVDDISAESAKCASALHRTCIEIRARGEFLGRIDILRSLDATHQTAHRASQHQAK